MRVLEANYFFLRGLEKGIGFHGLTIALTGGARVKGERPETACIQKASSSSFLVLNRRHRQKDRRLLPMPPHSPIDTIHSV